jgi:hypothetical protein
MNKLLKAALSMVAVGLLWVGQAQAVPITGDLGFAGATTFNTTSLATATQVTSWFAVVGTTSGSFLGVPIGSAINLATSWIFNPSTATPGLWSVGGFTFDLATATIDVQNSGLLSITEPGRLPALDSTRPLALGPSARSQQVELTKLASHLAQTRLRFRMAV